MRKSWHSRKLVARRAEYPSQAKRRASFCEQKEAKKLFYTGPCLFRRHSPKGAKVFAPLFLKAAAFSTLKQSPYTASAPAAHPRGVLPGQALRSPPRRATAAR